MSRTRIISRWTTEPIFESDDVNLLGCVEEAVRSGADLRGADLGAADLVGAYLSGADLGGALLMRDLDTLISLAPTLIDCCSRYPIEAVARQSGGILWYHERRAIIYLATDLTGGYCLVPGRKEIWWWSWQCPNPDTVPVLWRMEG